MQKLVEERVIEYIRSLIPPGERMMEDLAEQCRKNHIPLIEPEVAQLLLLLVKTCGCKRILEIGSGVGYSAIWLGKAVRKHHGSVTTIEREKDRFVLVQRNIRNAGMDDYIHPIYGDAAEVLPKLEAPYDLVFLDAAKGQYLNFYPQIDRLLAPGGLLVADNVLYKGLVIPGSRFHRRQKTAVSRLRKFLRVLHAQPQLVTTILPLGDGVAVSYKEDV